MPRTKSERQKIRDDHPDSWVAIEAGDTIFGKIVDVTDAWSDQRRDPVTGKQGAPYPLLMLLASEATGYEGLPKELKVHCFGAILFNEIMRKQPGIGEAIRITYGGAGEAKQGQNAPELYTVRAGAGTDVAQRAYAAIGGRRAASAEQPVQPELAQQAAEDDIPF